MAQQARQEHLRLRQHWITCRYRVIIAKTRVRVHFQKNSLPLRPLARIKIDQSLVAPADSNHRDHDHLVVDLVDQSVTRGAQLDLVAGRHAVQTRGGNMGIAQTFGELVLELFAETGVRVDFLPRCQGNLSGV